MKMFKDDVVHPLLQQMFKMATLHGHKPRNVVSILSVVSSTAVCCMPDDIALRHCSSCSFKFKKVLQIKK